MDVKKRKRPEAAKLEAGDASVSIKLLIRALLTVGASRKDVAHALARRVA